MAVRTAKTSVETDDGIDPVVDQLLGTLLWLAVTLGALALVSSLVRWAEQGWHPRYVVHIVVYVMILGTLIAGRRLSRRVRGAVVVIFIGLNGLSNLYFDGLRGNGTLALASGCILAGVFLGRRAAVVGVVGSLCALTLIAAGYVKGALPLPNDLGSTLRSPAEWFAYTATFAVFVVACVASVEGMQRALRESLARLQQRTLTLRERERHYRLLAENVQDIVFTQDMQLNITYVSPSAQRVFGYTAEELAKITMREILTPESFHLATERFQAAVARAAYETVDIPLMEYEYVRKDGSRFWGELKVDFIRDRHGELCGSQGILRDVTDRRRAQDEHLRLQERLRESERLHALGQLAGGVAHDFNNQLAGIIGFTDLLMLSHDSADVRDIANNILGSARRAADLTAQLLAFARRGPLRVEAVDLHSLVREVTSMLERSIEKTVRIRLELNAPRAVVSGDSSLLQNALLNVALNARDAMPAGGELSFQTLTEPASSAGGSQHDRLVLRIVDTGVGMDADTQRHIFEPFFTTKGPGRGTGMGLAAVHGTVQSHGGTIDVESAPGLGSAFTIRLPIALGDRASLERPAQPIMHGAGHVLLIDDEPNVRAMIGTALKAIGYRVTACANANEAVEIFQWSWRDIDLVLLDLVLPDRPGQQVFGALRTINPNASILIVSGYNAGQDVGTLIEHGAAGFLQKPFSVSELSRWVASIITRPSAPLVDSPS